MTICSLRRHSQGPWPQPRRPRPAAVNRPATSSAEHPGEPCRDGGLIFADRPDLDASTDHVAVTGSRFGMEWRANPLNATFKRWGDTRLQQLSALGNPRFRPDVDRRRAAAKREGEDEITELEVTCLLADFATVWNELFPAEQARIVQLLVERVDVQEDALEVRIRAEGLASLVAELRQDERRAA